MNLTQTIRRIAAIFGFVGLIVLTLNIERIAQANGLDQLLPDPIKGGWLGVLQKPSIIVAAALALGLAVGLWLDSVLRKFTTARPPKPKPFVLLGRRMEAMAKRLGAMQEYGGFYSEQDRRTAWSDLVVLFTDLQSSGVPIPDMSEENAVTPDELMRYLTHVGAWLSRDDLARAILSAKEMFE